MLHVFEYSMSINYIHDINEWVAWECNLSISKVLWSKDEEMQNAYWYFYLQETISSVVWIKCDKNAKVNFKIYQR